MNEPKIKMFTVERLSAPSLRKQEEDALTIYVESERQAERERRRSRRRQRRQDRVNAIAWRALSGIEPGGQEYVDCPPDATRIRLAEDDNGDMLAPRDRRSGWYEQMRWWKPLHWLAWWRTYRTKQIVMVERGLMEDGCEA